MCRGAEVQQEGARAVSNAFALGGVDAHDPGATLLFGEGNEQAPARQIVGKRAHAPARLTRVDPREDRSA